MHKRPKCLQGACGKAAGTFARVALAGVLSCALVPATAFATESDELPSIVVELADKQQDRWEEALATGDLSALVDSDAYNYEEGDAAEPLAALPTSLDLRDQGVVTPVKMQNPWGTCWGFAAVAASETSILSELGLTYDEFPLDLSELQLAWFSQTALPEGSGSQAGEGNYAVDPDNRLNTGGNTFTATSIFSSGIGPIAEEYAPYRNAEGITVNMPDGTPVYYSAEGDWSVDESLRFAQSVELEESSILPTPAGRDSSGAYEYNESGTIAIKNELMQGRAVEISFCADQSMPGQGVTGHYINVETWAHYTYETSAENPEAAANHAVTIVGWDDDYSASNFNEGHQPPADGAWIVKNSWGSISEEFPNCMPTGWGVDGEGYFYLSYYDQSISTAETLDFDVEGMFSDRETYYANVYDYLPSQGVTANTSSESVKMANVFTADADQVVRTVATETATPGTTVTYAVYVLNEDATSPVDGRLAGYAVETYEYGGFHRADLAAGIPVKEGQKFSVVVEQRTASGLYQFLVDAAINEEGARQFIEQGYAITSYAKGVVNEGESFLFSEGQWDDWANIVTVLKSENPGIDFDNFAIKAYSEEPENAAFDDVTENDWYAEAVAYVNEHGIMTGYAGSSLFGAADSMLRKDMACMLYKYLAPEEAVKQTDPDVYRYAKDETGFADAQDGTYFTAAVNWCVENGFMQGCSESEFDIDGTITREQFVTVLARVAEGSGDASLLDAFPDANDVSSWATPSMAWAVENGIIEGSEGMLLPRADATRAEIAKIMMVFDQKTV